MKAKVEFLLEIGCEEIPAGMIPNATKELQVTLEKYAGAHNLLNGVSVETFGGPRRLVAVVSGLNSRQPEQVREVVGPPKAVAFDHSGKPTRAAESFAQKSGMEVSDLLTVSTPRGEYVAARQVTPGRSAKQILEEIIPHVVAEISWPRSMYWTGITGLRFIRPIRWVVAMLGGQSLRFRLADAQVGNCTTGHRFLGRAKIPVRNAADYLQKLRANYVLARPEHRRKKIESELQKLATGKGLRVHVDPYLLTLVTNLNEFPTAILGDFDSEFLDLPEEILITVMRDHQKYFAVERKDGSLAPNFLAVINLERDRAGLIRAGHERVLRARFADARFFWESDQKCRLADYLPKLGKVVFQAKLGSYGDKVERMRALARWLAEQWFARGISHASLASADRAAELAKCDLVTGMVGEFPELQGVVGGLYAKSQEEPEDVFLAIYDHYKPSAIDEPLPRNISGQAVALADKLDTLVGCFAAGLVPSGSSDPYALRRAAMGIVRILIEGELPLSLSAAIARAAKNLEALPPGIQVSLEVEGLVAEFILDRARFVLKELRGLAYDEVNAAFAAGADDLLDAARRTAAIHRIRRTRNFEPLASSFKRIRKILEKAGPASNWKLAAVLPEAFTEEAERHLFSQAQEVARAAGEEKRQGKYRDALQRIAGLRPAVDHFFEDVLVMAEDDNVRRNRLTLLAGLLSEFSTIADFSEIVAGEKG